MSLQAEIDAAEPGATLNLAPGLHELGAPLVLRQAVTLRGRGATLRLSSGRDAVVRCIGAGPFRLVDLKIEYAGEGPARGIWIEAGEAHLEGCSVRGALWSDSRDLGCGIHFSNESHGSVTFCELFDNDVGVLLDHSSQTRLESNRCHDNRRHGLRATAHARLRAAQNECRDNGECGCWVDGQARAEFEGNRCHGNGTHGVLLGGSSHTRAGGNELNHNAHHGLSVEESAWAELQGQVCEENSLCGLDLAGSSRVGAADNYCTLNGWHGIQVRDSAWPSLSGNRCRQNGHSGLAYYGRGGGTARDGWLEENSEYAIQVSDEGAPSLQGNRCARNGLSGLAYFGSSAGMARANQCREHAYHGLQVSDSAAPLMEENLAQENGLFGFACFGSSRPLLRHNEARGNSAGGFHVGDEAEPALTQNRALDNKGPGIQLAGQAHVLLSDNALSGNHPCGLQVGPDAGGWLGAHVSSGHLTEIHNLGTRLIMLEQQRVAGKRVPAGHGISVQDANGQALTLTLSFEPKESEKLVLEALARHGKLSEGELGKVARTRRVSGLMETLMEKLSRGGSSWIEIQGQGSDGVIYAFRAPR